ncbi:MAG: TIGR04211 family SH3 domain-containing protein [Methylococcaceae bacterium]|nr:MAG: TIGR04211 family SH3 domain-containing protein [Methylococcaceae bacterium]
MQLQYLRKYPVRKLILAACLLCPMAAHAAGQSVFVSDKLEAQLRSGPSLQHKIIRALNSGVALTIVEEDKAAGYTHVTNDNGVDGWILSRHLISQPPARTQLENTTQKMESLAQENKQLRGELDNLKKQLAEAGEAKDSTSLQVEQLNSELTAIRQASSGAVALLQERNQLQEERAALKNELENLNREKETLAEKDSQDWFMKGAGVLFGGMLLGIILPKLAGRKRRGWDTGY